ncbi:family 20 glycosylhydrolase [Hymenobacter sp. HMF4947]|uniref:Family 20 glycosylhydrolase n=1 Tax=Hymenobacter ginkgonis TaxID=2682976 RepID=A0A7K1TJE0_9BACT|nr:family 20 glycosylhydrolase [Hymenobacter ginkgonis]MVN78515.1 family 20 glycosylhydrolase [Hymenobacter ginkgonis]
MMRFWIGLEHQQRFSFGNLALSAKMGTLVLLLLVSLTAQAQRPLLPLPAQASWLAGYYAFKTAPLLALRRQTTGAATSTDESYRLRITAAGASLTAASPLGIQRGLATFRQVIESTPRGWRAQFCDIQDAPRFRWRGLLLDAARHFQPVAAVKRNLDGMAAVKLNVLHWHLCDDQGWRVESKLFPRLHTVAGATGYYTQAEVREVVRYAQARGIRVVPEFDLPGHTGALLAAYPRLACNDSIKAVPIRWGVLNIALDPTREGTYTMLDSVLTEMSGLFPDPYFHIGGDENDGRQWRHNPRIVAFMQQKGFVKTGTTVPDKHQLQNYFNRRILVTLQKLGKTMIGWDEILGPDLPQAIMVESWRGPKGVAEAARQGHPALRAHGYYLDLYLTAASSYAADPLQGVPDSLQARVLGGEAAMWSEFADSVIYESRVWPRAAAVAERLWSPAALAQNVPDMYRRLAFVSEELEALGLRHRRVPAALLRQLAAPYPAALPALQTLAAIAEPVKEYKRHFQGFKYTTETPLTRLVDAAPAESDVARRFGATVDSLLASLSIVVPAFPVVAGPPALSPASSRQLASLRQQVAEWQHATEALPPLFVTSPSLAEYAPLSAQLGIVAGLLSQRLTQLAQGQPALAAWQAAAKLQLDAAQKPVGQTELAIISAARLLVGM